MGTEIDRETLDFGMCFAEFGRLSLSFGVPQAFEFFLVEELINPSVVESGVH